MVPVCGIFYHSADYRVCVAFVKILGHVQSVGSVTLVDLMTAVIHGEAQKRPVLLPAFLYEFVQSSEGEEIGSRLTQSLYALGSVFVYQRVLVSVVYIDEVVLVLTDELYRNGVDLFHGVEYVVVHIPSEIDIRCTAVGFLDYGGTFSSSDKGVEDAVDSDNGFFVFSYAVDFGLSAGIHGPEADGRHHG